ncbi:MAG: OmpA family protein [Candidatus Omnitrophica bacterium]|nr:OmpA family protein [Candidatus Omnitrophota bacterium]
MRQTQELIADDEPVVFDDEPSGGPPGWMVTFGDSISLLLTFFVLLLSFSSFDPSSAQRTLITFSSVISMGEFDIGTNLRRLDLSSEIDYKGTDFDQLIEESKKEGTLELSEEEINESLMLEHQKTVDFTVKQLRKLLDESDMQDGIRLESNQSELSFAITIDQGIAFREGKASLKNSAYAFLKNLSILLQDIPNDIIITGYANEELACPPEELREEQFKLAILRADKIARYFIKVAYINPARISITGYGGEATLEPHDPKKPPKVPSRVTITVTGTFDGYLLTLKNRLLTQDEATTP